MSNKTNNQSSLFGNLENQENEFEFVSSVWEQKEVLSEEFKSLGFYISDHPLNEYGDIFNQLKVISYDHFLNIDVNEGLVAGTIMSIQEKKIAKGLYMQLLNLAIKQESLSCFYFRYW